MEFIVDDMTCGGCVASLTRAVRRVDPGATVEADLATRRLTVGTERPLAEIAEAIGKAGFESRAA